MNNTQSLKDKGCKHDFRFLELRYDTYPLQVMSGYKFYCTKCLMIVNKKLNE